MKTDKNKGLHPRNKHNQNYNFSLLISEYPDLKKHINLNKFGSESIDFTNPDAVRSLNSALLKYYYQIHFYRLPKTNLCPPIPGRADYIHYIADLLAKGINGTLPTGSGIKILDIGTGANCIYPILGNKIYGWTFVGTEIDKPAKLTAEKIIEENELTKSITLRLQESKRNILKNIIQPSERFDCVICNPPFHNSREEATKSTLRKLHNLGKKVESSKPILNFGGQNNELWCEGGEKAFITNFIYESVHFKSQVKWFTSLVSKKEHLKNFETILKKLKATFEIIPMEQGNKTTRILAWRFL
ncbi:23S rRNA mA1618 methyltransferase [Flavobacterium columnare ATCC 49512]|uniref:Ribosomal RNA large subunit methyltransferase F n=1 Tax=Flavobacterium columnare (strain ATCC 49512 / CIP 103533 / TG 44/87) TaxID=1041826 RepID=G8X7H1_FLACA|nr:23S rRNA (adenine(1618)-N(6))-methyltransferase RlmF [Flavobacterium columnare]AEW84985.1 23S rRNA mA1618 methyltransferase [Flavobacterium columnare ATCC 49512]MBF6659248.1 23S rRNA (adenine(1618)-N(6))-methyltransferase RlmF [Flavobacterium columnare]